MGFLQPHPRGHAVVTVTVAGSDLEHLPAVDAQNAGPRHDRLTLDVLMSVDQQPGLRPRQIGAQSVKANVDAIVAIMYPHWRIVGEEDVDRGESRQAFLHLFLLVQKMTTGLIFP